MRRAVRVLGVAIAAALAVLLVVTGILLQSAALNGAWGGFNLNRVASSGDPAAAGSAARGVGAAASATADAAGLWSTLLGWNPLTRGLANRLDAVSTPLSSVGAAATNAAPALPDALGANGPKRYLVCALNDAELYGSGGAPLHVTMIEMDHGSFSTPISGTTGVTISPGWPLLKWDKVGGPPWYQPGVDYSFGQTMYQPNFPFAGQNIMRAWEVEKYPKLDGVLTLDVAAVANILRETGPINSQGYGNLTADNIRRKLLIDAYREFPEDVPGANDTRRKYNDALVKALTERITDPAQARGVAAGLAASIPERHLQAYMSDPVLQRSVTDLKADGSLTTAPGDLMGVFLQSYRSKVSLFQQRSIRREVTVAADGSAKVKQTVINTNAVPDDVPGDRNSDFGYLALIQVQWVAYRIPAAATEATVSTSGKPLVAPGQTGPYQDQSGAQVLWQGTSLSPGARETAVVSYSLPPGTFGSGDQRIYKVTTNPQAFPSPVDTEIRVTFEGAPANGSGQGWSAEGGAHVWRGQLDNTLSLSVAP